MNINLGLLESRGLTVFVRIGLGVIFIAAALPKIADPPSFAHMIYNYRLLPGALINMTALVLPWFELLCGIALVLGIWKRTAVMLVGAMLVVFLVAIAINVMRLHPIDCGCFDLSAAGKTPTQQMFDMLWVMVRDVAMLAMVVQIMLGTRPVAEA